MIYFQMFLYVTHREGEVYFLVSLFTDLYGDACNLVPVYTVLYVIACYKSMAKQKWCMARFKVHAPDIITLPKLVTVYNH